MSGTCISLSGSTQCAAFNVSSISTNPTLFTDLYVDTESKRLGSMR
jgi:hypothetical protein